MSEFQRWGSIYHASAIRLAVLVVWTLTAARTPYGSYSEFPPEVLSGFGVGRLILADPDVRSALLSWPVLSSLKWLTVGACITAMLSSRLAPVVMSLVLATVIVLDSLTKSLSGFANHAQIVPLLLLGVFTLASRVPFLTVPAFVRETARNQVKRADGNASEYAAITWLVSLVIVLPYSYIGWQRIWSGGAELFLGDALLQMFAAASRSFQQYPDWLDVVALKHVLNTGFFVTTLFEASSSLLLVSRTYRRAWLLSMGLFHLSTIFFMNIFFWENLLVASVTFWWGWTTFGTARMRDSEFKWHLNKPRFY